MCLFHYVLCLSPFFSSLFSSSLFFPLSFSNLISPISFSPSLLCYFLSGSSRHFTKPITSGIETFIIVKNMTIESNIGGGAAKPAYFGVEGRCSEDFVWI